MPIGTNRRAGRPPADEKTEIVAALLPDWSPRTRARYVTAWRLAEFADLDIVDLIRQYARANGTVRVAALFRRAEDMAAMRIARREMAR
ncbi:MAG: hypothetical protein ACYCT1_05090 [Steroidobacteraceae bacterium]